MYSKTFAATIVASLMAAANAHLAIQSPAPIPGSNSKSPLDPSGSNFPCQGASLTGGPVTNMAAGSSQKLEFDLGGGANWAVHGGGSCQISITYETDAAKLKNPANWKVLHSWIGGCPTDAKGNLDPVAIACTGNGGTNCVNQGFTFNIPQEVKAGNGILAWTWFNNIGNREMYMNCARVSISGGNGNVDSLPGMFAANIGNGCSTSESFNTDFPNPGKYVTKDASMNYPLKAGVGSCGSGAGSAGTPSSSGSGSSAGSSAGSAASSKASGAVSVASPAGSAVASAAPAAPAAPAASGSSGSGRKGASGTFAEGAGSAPAPAASAAASKPEVPVAGATGASASGGAVACSAQGFYCISATSFGICNNGFAVPQQVAPGTTCSGTAIAAVRRHLNIRHMQHRRHYFGSSL